MNAIRKEKTVKKLIAVAALATALTACGGGSAGLHDPATLAKAEAATFDPTRQTEVKCSAIDDETLTCQITTDGIPTTFLGKPAVEMAGTYIVHVTVSEDGKTAEVSAPEGQTLDASNDFLHPHILTIK